MLSTKFPPHNIATDDEKLLSRPNTIDPHRIKVIRNIVGAGANEFQAGTGVSGRGLRSGENEIASVGQGEGKNVRGRHSKSFCHYTHIFEKPKAHFSPVFGNMTKIKFPFFILKFNYILCSMFSLPLRLIRLSHTQILSHSLCLALSLWLAILMQYSKLIAHRRILTSTHGCIHRKMDQKIRIR